MHELSIARPLSKEVLKRTSGKKPSRIVIAVGGGAGIDGDFLRHSFDDHIFPELGWKDVELILEDEAPSVRCASCGKTIPDAPSINCPFCGSDDIKIAGGDRVYIKEVVL